MKRSNVVLSGVVEEINLETRDIVLVSKTPTGEDTRNTIHLWKTESDGDNPAWRGRKEWKNDLQLGDFISVNGWMGNNKRVISFSYTKPTNSVQMLGVVAEAHGNGLYSVLTETPKGKAVHSYVTVAEDGNILVGDTFAFTGFLSDGVLQTTDYQLYTNPYSHDYRDDDCEDEGDDYYS